MTLRFTETAPGVYTSSILDAKTGKSHNIAIIESCNAWQLFIDGELSARDLPSFKAAIASAEGKFKAQPTPVMLRAACVLVIASIAGASLIGATKLLGFMLQEPVLAAHMPTPPAATQTSPIFQRVKPNLPKTENASALVNPAQPVKFATEFAAENVVVSLVTEPPSEPQPANEEPAAVAAATLDNRRFSAEHPALAATRAAVRIVSETKAATTVEPRAQPAILNAKPVASTPAVARSQYEAAAQPASTELPAITELETNIATSDETAGPVLPTKAPLIARPLIRPQSAPLPASLLAEIERAEANQEPNHAKSVYSNSAAEKPLRRTANQKRIQNQDAPRAERKETQKRRLKAERIRTRARQATARSKPAARSGRHSRTAGTCNHSRTAEAYRAAPAPRMVCFAHTCKFR